MQRDIGILRDLAKRYMEIALSEKHEKMRQRFRDTNDLKIVRPPLIMEEIPWGQMNMDGELDCICEHEEFRGTEYFFRERLFREKHFACDNYIEPFFPVWKTFTSTGNGLDVKERTIFEPGAGAGSHQYEDILPDENALSRFHAPFITARPEIDRFHLEKASELFGDSIPVKLLGHGIYYAPWDQIAMYRGVQPILYDLYDRPAFLHKIISVFTEGMRSEMDQMEALGLYEKDMVSVHSTPGYVTVPEPSSDGKTRCRDIWFRTMAQMFAAVSPAAHEEFDVQYSAPLAERCGVTYYGCCEPLHDRIGILQRYPNLRKIGVSPWADISSCAEQIGGRYVMSRKPNPAHVAAKTEPEVIRREIIETVRACQKFGCPLDITLKDITTVNHDPGNLIVWAKTASEVLDVYYGD